PHAYFEQIPEPMLIFARLSKGVDFDAPDDRPVDKIFMLLGGKRDHTQHLMIMARLSRMLKDTGFRQTLDTAGQPGAVLDAVRDVESRH
ncbi:PTS sugar transporter subunit IIA, partial [bacterium]|nr:PTS sugar transporter subunit IIA [bacterium]